MKQNLIAIALMLTLTIPAGASITQTPKANVTVGVKSNKVSVTVTDSTLHDELEAFSDTTAIDDDTTEPTQMSYNQMSVDIDGEDLENIGSLFKLMGGATVGMTILMLLLLFLILLLPFLIVALIFYLIYKNRKQRLQLAEQAIRSGQPIPDSMAQPQPQPDPDLWTKGMRQLFLGAGLAILLGLTVGKIGFGVGALVLCIGIGNLVIARQQKNKKEQDIENNIYKF
jgi:hypothetical protein